MAEQDSGQPFRPCRAADIRDLLEAGIVHCPGSVDRLRSPVLFAKLELLEIIETHSASDLRSFFGYFISITKESVRENGFVFVLDCTKGPVGVLADFLDLIHEYFPGRVNRVYVIQRPTQDGYAGRVYFKLKSFLSSMQGTTDYPKVSLNSYTELQKVIDAAQVPSYFDGHLNYDHKLWVETRIELEKLMSDFEEQSDNISKGQESLISAIPTSLSELTSFEKVISPLREKVYLPTQHSVSRAASLVAEEKLARTEAPGSSRFRYCPLSTIHVIDTRTLQRTHEKLYDLSDNFLNLWGLQLQKVYLEKFSLCETMLMTKLLDLQPTVSQALTLTISNVEPQFHFYSSIYTTLIADDKKLYESAMGSHAKLRDWTYTASLPCEDLEGRVRELSRAWSSVTQTVNSRRKALQFYNKLKGSVVSSMGSHGDHYQQVSSITVSENVNENLALPVGHHAASAGVLQYCSSVQGRFEGVSTDQNTVHGNIDISSINSDIEDLLGRVTALSELSNQCLAIKEQISLFYTHITAIQQWLTDFGHPFISYQTLGTSLEESKEGKNKFLKFIGNSGLDATKQRISQCSKTLNVINNSQLLSDRSLNLVHDAFTRIEVDWKGFGLEVQEHGRDLELSIEFYEAAQNVSHWLTQEEDKTRSILNLETDSLGREEMSVKMEELSQFKQDMSERSGEMDVCHSKFIALSASTNGTLRHIKSAKHQVDSSWTRFSERIRTAEKEIERRFKEVQVQEDRRSLDGLSAQNSSTSSVESLDFETEAEHLAFRNTKLLIQELVQTEKRYVEDLRDIVTGYKEKIESEPYVPKSLRNNTTTVFGNIQDLYNFHSKEFLGQLERSMEDSSNVGTVFCANKSNFDMYATYCKNKPNSENFLQNVSDSRFLEQCQRELTHVLDLSSYLLKPVQRIMKYHLILEKLLKYSPQRKHPDLTRALEIMERVPRYANDAIHLMGLEGYHGDFDSLGQLLMQENFLVYICGQKKPTSRQIFCFESAILFSKPAPRSTKPLRKVSSAQVPKYSYKNHVSLSQIGVTRFLPEDTLNVQFQIRVYLSDQKNVTEWYTLQATSTACRDAWLAKIEELLFAQFEGLKNRAASNVL